MLRCHDDVGMPIKGGDQRQGILAARIDGQPIRWEIEMQDRPPDSPASKIDGMANKPMQATA